jgi:hypothetical protein
MDDGYLGLAVEPDPPEHTAGGSDFLVRLASQAG